MAYKLIVWDFDGTLADTLQLGARIFNDMAGRHGFTAVDDVQAARKLGLREFMRRHRISWTRIPAATKEFLAAQRLEMPNVRLFAGLADVLAQLRGRGCRLGIVSSNDPENIRVCLRANGAEGCFDFVVGVSRLLGKGSAIRTAVRRERLTADEVLYVGDEVRDIEAARRAGVAVASVTWGFQALEVLSQHSPDHVVQSPAELLELAPAPAVGA